VLVTGEKTIPTLWRDALLEQRTSAAYLTETAEGWREVSWEEAGTAVTELANGLLALGVRKGDAFAIMARTTLEWALFDFALAHVGAITAPIYPSSSPSAAAYIAEHSESIGILTEDSEQLAALTAESTRGRLEHRLTFADLDSLRERGRGYASSHPGALDEAAGAISEDDLFTYIYTSGTTGPPKACMIRHRNYYDMCSTVGAMQSLLKSGDTVLLYLPLAHNFGRLTHLLGPFLDYTIAFCPDPLRVGEVLPEVRPTVLPSVPRVFEKVHTAVVAKFDEATGLKRRLVDWALRVGRRVSVLRQQGKPIPAALAAQHRIADKLVYSKVKARLGGRLRAAVSGGAPLAKEIAEYFHALDILILEGYGQTECTTGCAANRVDRFRFGTVGPAMPGFEIRIAEDGEILIKGPTIFAGYYKDEESTRAVLDEDGWLHSGDVGELDEDGFLTITDRKKDIIVTAGGKNIAPQNLENELKASRFVSQALVVGDRRPYIVALVTLDEAEVKEWAEQQGFDGDLAALSEHEQVQQLVAEIVERVNSDRSGFEQIKRFAVLPRDFAADHEEVTPTLKLRRRICEQHFAEEIDRLYAT
jgi:long-chain acyl-CoA synthetase